MCLFVVLSSSRYPNFPRYPWRVSTRYYHGELRTRGVGSKTVPLSVQASQALRASMFDSMYVLIGFQEKRRHKKVPFNY